MQAYRKRIVDDTLPLKLEGSGAVLIEGPKWCGKTTTAEQHAKSVAYINDPSNGNQLLHLAELNPQLLLEGDTPRLLDQWQIAPQLWDAVRFTVDHREGMGQFILTGSAVPADLSSVHHTGTGRFSWLKMRTMSLYESGDSTGDISLQKLFDGTQGLMGKSNVDIEALAFLMCRGGWPKALELNQTAMLSRSENYFDAVNHDLSRVDGIKRNATRAHRIMRSLARHQGTQTSIDAIRSDIQLNEGDNINNDTIASYLEAMGKIFVIEDSTAWNPNLRSKAAIRTSDTRYFTDPSIATNALGAGPNDLLHNLQTMGLILETLCIRDLRVYSQPLGGSIYHYRDSYGLECDAIVHLRNGHYGLIEIKLGGQKLIEQGMKTLLKLSATLDTSKMPQPSFRMVLTGVGSYAYQEKNGIYIVPIGALRP